MKNHVSNVTTEAKKATQKNVAELGKATVLTLGGGSGGAESKNRPFGSGGDHKANK
jgi:hypothetical protein